VIIGLLLLQAACTRPNYGFFAAVKLRQQAEEELRLQVDRMGVFTATETSDYELYPERMPAWARDDFEACVYWTSPVEFRSTFSHDIVHNITRVWGWALVGRKLEFHVLEISCEDAETGEVIRLIDQWAAPEPAEAAES
jgi:hypothetical protein